MTILRCINDNGDKFDLDLLEQVPFTLDISAIESGNIGQVFGVSSQKLTLPPSKTNNEFFGNLYDVGSTPSTSFIKTVPCQVLSDGIEIFTGELYLESVVTDNNGDDLYNVVVVNETVDFGFLIKDTTFADLDFSSLNHDYTYGNITSSWDQTLEDGAVFYPLINYGFDEDNLQDTQIKGGGEPRSFSNYNSPVQVDDFKPAIRLRDCLDAIFANTPYDYTSSLFSSGSYTDDIYLLASKDDKKGISDINPVSQSFLAYNNANQTIPAQTGPQKVNFQLELFDNGGNWDNSTSTFTAGEDGDYQFKVQFNYNVIGFTSAQDARTLNIRIYKNGSEEVFGSFNLQGTTSGLLNYVTPLINLEATDTIEIYASYTEIASGPPDFRINTSGTQTRLELRQAPSTEIGAEVDLSRVYSDISIPDFMSGLIEKFNLVIEPVRNERNVLRIETFNDWVDAGRTVDWSNKVDYNQKWDIKHPLQNQPKDITFTDVEDNIAIVQYHKRTQEKIYGEYKYISDSDLTKGNKTIGKLFAPTPFKGIDGAPYVVMPALCEKDDSAQAYKRTKFAPRLLFHNGRKNAFGLVGENSTGGRTNGVYYFKDEDGTVHTENDYGLASHLQDVEADFDTTIDLHYGNTFSPGHYNYHQAEYNGQVKRTAFYEYWSFYVNELYDVDSRLVTLNVFLNPTEIPDIQLNDKIHIDGHYYRINKIQGANVLREDSIAVELIKTLPRQLRFPRRRIFLDDTPVDITVDDASFSASGKVGYSDFNTGTTYTGSAVPGAAQRDGFQVYGTGASQETVWNTLKPTEARFTAQTNIGLNEVDKSAETVDARGNGNKVRNNTQVVRVEGSDNTIENNAKFVTVTGTDNTIEQNVENSAIQQSTTSSISEDTTLSTIIGGEDSHISGSNKTVLIGQDLTVEGGNSNIAIGNFDVQNKTIKDLINVTAININKSIDSADDYENGLAYMGSTHHLGAKFADNQIITVSNGDTIYLTGSEYAHDYYTHFIWSGGSGTANVYLPDTDPANFTGGKARDSRGYKRELRFFGDENLASNTRIRLYGSGSDTVDSTTSPSFVELKKAFDAVTLYAYESGSWIVTQAKA